MARRTRNLFLVLLAVCWTDATRAGVEGTHHDMRLYNLEEEESVCGYCHVPHRAATDESLLVREGVYESELGRVGAFCYTCHDGTVVPTALVEAPDGTLGIEALTRSHGLVVDEISPKTDGLEDSSHVGSSGLVSPDPQTGSLPERMECTACHDPHNSTNQPFLVAPIEDLCQRCHSGSDRQGQGRFSSVEDEGESNGPHPVGMPVVYSWKDRTRPAQLEPEMVFHGVNPLLRVPGLSAAEQGDPTKHWSTGGHLGGFDENPQTGAVMCSTCHSAHSVGENLLVLAAYDELSASDPLCAGCHGLDASPQNPGGTPFYHPAHDESSLPYATSTIPQRALDISLPIEWPIAQDGSLLCATCHRAHQGQEGKKCVRENTLGRKYICDACHLPDDDVSEENDHHFSSWEDSSALLAGRTLSWETGPGEPGDLTDGLTCIDCHTELAKSAHNW